MIKAAGQTGLGVPLAFFGLSGENITRLVAGEPIRVGAADMQQLGLPPIEIVIHYGKTESAMLAEIAAHGIKLRSGPSPHPGDQQNIEQQREQAREHDKDL